MSFSFLEDTSHPAELVELAKELRYAAMAVTDRNSLASIVRARSDAKDTGLHLIVDAEITPVDALGTLPDGNLANPLADACNARGKSSIGSQQPWKTSPLRYSNAHRYRGISARQR